MSDAGTGTYFRYFSFSGRVSRGAFLPVLAATLLMLVPLSISIPPLAAIIALLLILPLGAAATRRLHDVGLSGRWLLPLVVLPLLMLVMLVLGNSMLTLILVAVLDGTVSDGDLSRFFITAETVLAWVWAVSALLSCVAFCWTGVAGSNRYGDDPRSIS